MRPKRKTGRLKVDFEAIREFASHEVARDGLRSLGFNWRLTRHSAVYRCKDGSFTVCLVWHGDGNMTLTKTFRNVRLVPA